MPRAPALRPAALDPTLPRTRAQITVITKPKLPEGVPLPNAGDPISRVRISSHKLQACIPIDGVDAETTVLEVKRLLLEALKRAPIFLTIAGAEADERTGTMKYAIGDHFVNEGPGYVQNAKGPRKLRRVRDNACGTVNDADIVQLLLEPEKQLVLFQGALLADDTTLGGAGCVNSERLYLEFRAPWEPEEGEAPGAAKPPPKKKK